MTNRDITSVIVRDLENKKRFTAEYDGRCSTCSHPILEGDEFIFMGNKEKICTTDCLPEIMDHMESL